MVDRDPRRSGRPLASGLENEAPGTITAQQIEKQSTRKRQFPPQQHGAGEEHGRPAAFQDLVGDPAPSLAALVRQPESKATLAMAPAATSVQEAADSSEDHGNQDRKGRYIPERAERQAPEPEQWHRYQHSQR